MQGPVRPYLFYGRIFQGVLDGWEGVPRNITHEGSNSTFWKMLGILKNKSESIQML